MNSSRTAAASSGEKPRISMSTPDRLPIMWGACTSFARGHETFEHAAQATEKRFVWKGTAIEASAGATELDFSQSCSLALVFAEERQDSPIISSGQGLGGQGLGGQGLGGQGLGGTA